MLVGAVLPVRPGAGDPPLPVYDHRRGAASSLPLFFFHKKLLPLVRLVDFNLNGVNDRSRSRKTAFRTPYLLHSPFSLLLYKRFYTLYSKLNSKDGKGAFFLLFPLSV